ncbi:hypothetical protein Tco_1129259 [Tanacetum coccineum]
MGRGVAPKPMIMGVSHYLRGDSGIMPTAKGIGLRVPDSHTSNHLEDDFTLLETIQRAYGGEPTVILLRSFLNLGRVGDWITLSNRGSADVPIALVKPITHLANWNGSFFYVKNRIIPSDYPELLLESNKFDKKYFGDKVPLHPELDPLYDQISTYPCHV